jgi:hypothetical protein
VFPNRLLTTLSRFRVHSGRDCHVKLEQPPVVSTPIPIHRVVRQRTAARELRGGIDCAETHRFRDVGWPASAAGAMAQYATEQG